jgi:hypothetical protein
MHARELLDLAAVVSVYGSVLVERVDELPRAAVEQYWCASKSRLDRWGRSLKELACEAATERTRGCLQRTLLRGVCEEILTGEVLTRLWTAVLTRWDRRRGTDLAEPVARSVNLGHLEARHRVLTLLVSGPGIDAEEAVQLNRLRRRTERWIDILLARLSVAGDVREFAIDADRLTDFAQDMDHQSRQQGGRHAWPLLMAALRAAFRQGLEPVSPNADLNEQIASAVLCAFPAELFNSVGLPFSVWLTRIFRITDEASGMLASLVDETPGEKELFERYRRFGAEPF